MRGTVTGVYSTFTNIGSFIGSTLTGVLFGIAQDLPVYVEGGLLAGVIVVIALRNRGGVTRDA
jgi:biopolymer transport protein ExbB/TolQ